VVVEVEVEVVVEQEVPKGCVDAENVTSSPAPST